MTGTDRWLLPEGVEELLPADASRVEAMRRLLLDLYARWGYELIIPPMIEFTDSLLVGLGSDLDIQTFKITDQATGRLMGIRPDITPQTARIDAHSLHREGPVRLCYAGSVLHTKARAISASRAPIQVGAELYGESGIAADSEIIPLMLETFNVLDIDTITLDLGHQGIVSSLMQHSGLDDALQNDIFEALQHKAKATISELSEACGDQSPISQHLAALMDLHGGIEVINRARSVLAGAPDEVFRALDQLQSIAELVARRYPQVNLHFDLAELHGYHYHTGLVFAVYHPTCGEAVANGGRYDAIGEAFGRARPATGFNTELKTLLRLTSAGDRESSTIFASYSDRADQWLAVSDLRAAGETVICGMPGEIAPADCSRELVVKNDRWTVVD